MCGNDCSLIFNLLNKPCSLEVHPSTEWLSYILSKTDKAKFLYNSPSRSAVSSVVFRNIIHVDLIQQSHKDNVRGMKNISLLLQYIHAGFKCELLLFKHRVLYIDILYLYSYIEVYIHIDKTQQDCCCHVLVYSKGFPSDLQHIIWKNFSLDLNP